MLGLYAGTIFLSAFLLFLVQPLMAKQILPWFGGSATVWTTCLVFFQSALLAGYAYSDALTHRLRGAAQLRVHAVLILLSLAALPVLPAAHWKPAGTENPSWLILGLLAATVGLPYFLLSTTSPLLQSWFARARPGVNPYRLFALSNLASMLALVGYPFLFEPWIATHAQAIGWSIAYGAYVVFALAAAWRAARSLRGPAILAVPAAEGADGPTHAPEPAPKVARQVLWCALAAMGSILLLAVSNHVTQNVAAVPLLWIVPLAVYLLTFILAFDGTGWYRRQPMLAILAAGLAVMAWTIADPRLIFRLGLQIGVFVLGLFVACLFCHGELVRLRPPTRHLTRFYLMISLGGAVGAVLVGIVAPLTLHAYFELGIALVACAALLVWQSRDAPRVFPVLGGVAMIVTLGCFIWSVIEFYKDTIVAERNFYGVLRVRESGSGSTLHRSLIHGTILHGAQYLAPELRRLPTTYYTRTSGIGRLLETLHPRLEPLRMGLIGLGTGTLASYGTPGDVYRFYDINPGVVGLARSAFTYLGDSEATIEVALGDARLNLEREPPQRFDVLVVDAFSSDAIPVHLITAEALDVYRRHIKPEGVIAFHVTNRYLDLVQVVARLAASRELTAVHVVDDPDYPGSKSDWVLMSSNAVLLARPQIAEAAHTLASPPGAPLWTDDYNNLARVLR